ncbi:hypothetical protein BJX70DRAFT_217487 [Aspergillus crustosus]
MASHVPSIQRAPTSCFSCRRSKRRCDKNLPACQLCTRRGLRCSYPQRRGQRPASPAETTRYSVRLASIPVDNNPEALSVPSLFSMTTAISFLAPSLFREAILESPRLDLGIPEEVALQIGNNQQIRETTTRFVERTRSWMPVVSPKRHLAAALNPLSPRRRPSALLSLCMRLCCLPPRDGDSTDRMTLYRLVKRFYSEVESTEGLCVQVLQAAVFIAVFEIGDAIYPAAYLTVGACARYAIAMGLDKVNKGRMGRGSSVKSWLEIEEARRVWWGVLVLDRFLNFANPSRSLATEDPEFEDYLPVDDDRFLDGTTRPEDTVQISQAFTLRIGHFSRLAQAIYLISKVLAIIRTSPAVFNDANASLPPETAQLCRTLEALVRANEMEVTIRKLAVCCQSLVSYSGVFLLQQHFWEQMKVKSTQEAQQHTFVETNNAFDTLCRISSNLQQGAEQQYFQGGQCTFFLAGVIYQAISALMTLGQGNPSAELEEKIALLQWALRNIRAQWPVSGVYERVLEAKEAVLAAEAV